MASLRAHAQSAQSEEVSHRKAGFHATDAHNFGVANR